MLWDKNLLYTDRYELKRSTTLFDFLMKKKRRKEIEIEIVEIREENEDKTCLYVYKQHFMILDRF